MAPDVALRVRKERLRLSPVVRIDRVRTVQNVARGIARAPRPEPDLDFSSRSFAREESSLVEVEVMPEAVQRGELDPASDVVVHVVRAIAVRRDDGSA